jgi:hypothetical protein
MRKERTLTTFLEDGTKEGVKKISIGTYTGEMLFAPRNDFERVKAGWKEIITKRGVYFLFGEDDDGLPKVYVGKADCVSSRISSHVKEKHFWNDFAVFTEPKLGPTEISYLESALINRATNANSYSVENKVQPSAFDDIRKEVKAECERHIENIQLMLEMASRDILSNELTVNSRQVESSASQEPTSPPTNNSIDVFFKCHNGKVSSGIYNHSTGALKLLPGSWINTEQRTYQGSGIRKMAKNLLDNGHLQRYDDSAIFKLTVELEFSSPSPAASLAYGGPVNGRKEWKTADGKSINDLFYGNQGEQ